VAASSGLPEASDGGSARAEDDGVKFESSAHDPVKTSSSWIRDFDVSRIFEKIYNCVGVKLTTVIGGTISAEQKWSGDLFARTVEVLPAESKTAGTVVDVEAIGEDTQSSDSRFNDIPSVFGSRDLVETSSYASDSESTDSYHTTLTSPLSSAKDKSVSDELMSTRTQRLSSPVKRIPTEKRLNPVPSETGPLRVIIKEGWIDRPFNVRKLNP
jgi:hypothetical protein